MVLKEKIRLIFFFILFFNTNFLLAQDDSVKYGNNPEKCKINISLYREFYKQNNYDDAYEPWSWVFRECPAASKNTFIHGTTILWHKIKNAKDEKIKQNYIDTLMLLYDKRIEIFGEKGKVLGYKGIDYNKLFPNKKVETFKILKESLAYDSLNTNPAVLSLLFFIVVDLYKEKVLKDEDVINYYDKCSEALNYQLNLNPESEIITKSIEKIDYLLTTTDIASCEKILPILTKKFNNNKNNLMVLKQIVKLLNIQNCTENDVYVNALELLHNFEPTAFSAYSIAQLSYKMNDYQKAISYYQKAIDLDTNNLYKSQCYYEMAVITGLHLKQFSLARTYALKSIEYKKNFGKPYILIGQLYAMSAKECGENEYFQSLVYIAAVDKFNIAKSIDPTCAEEANKLIHTYSQLFPKKEDMFFYGNKENEPYTIGCWINETIKIKVRN